mmetsp:Transcript_3791/g.15176  ORF Transcript_3791/g.15176 Transcript_3791/m.15176 type:complete len:235 (+) Transcript_3791:2500-3204(+)
MSFHPPCCHILAYKNPCPTLCKTYKPHSQFSENVAGNRVTPINASGRNRNHCVPMEIAATFFASPTPSSAFCIVTDSASNATVMPVRRSGNVAFATASGLVKKKERSVVGKTTATKPTPNIIAAVSLATSQGQRAASSTSPLPSARPESAPAAKPMPMHGSTNVNIRLISTFTAAVSAVPSLPTIQYIAVMPVAKSRLVTDVGAAWPNRIFKSETVGLARAKPIVAARLKPMRR